MSLKLKSNPTICHDLSTKVYFVISERELKRTYINHTMSFRNRTYENNIELSKYIWSLKDQNKDFDIKWSIFKNLLDIVLHQNRIVFASWKE